MTLQPIQLSGAHDPRLEAALARPQLESPATLQAQVAEIIAAVRAGGDEALKTLNARFDACPSTQLWASTDEIQSAHLALDDDLIDAIDSAIATVRCFHEAGMPRPYRVETAPGVVCQAAWRPIDGVGLYVPAGGAPLPSTAIMLGVPARLAGCPSIVMATPPGPNGRPDPAVLTVAQRLGIERVLISGGAQAIGALAYGTETVPALTKLFGPGNRFVTEAKRQVAQDIDGAVMDMPAGPSEVMVIADATANPCFVAADLLSQAEHGEDSQVVLLTPSTKLAADVVDALNTQLPSLSRQSIATKALAHARVLVLPALADAWAVANRYAPEHLILAGDEAETWVDAIQTAGSVFVGHYTPEALGDYISGTNHVLPTGGWAKAYQGLSVSDFMRRMTIQSASAQGLSALGPKAARLAAHEGLDAHRLAIEIRLADLDGVQ